MLEATNGTTIIPITATQNQVYTALERAAYRIGQNTYHTYGPAKYNRKGEHTGGYYVTPEHDELVQAMPKVLSGEVPPEEAMALLHQYDTLKQRLG